MLPPFVSFLCVEVNVVPKSVDLKIESSLGPSLLAVSLSYTSSVSPSPSGLSGGNSSSNDQAILIFVAPLDYIGKLGLVLFFPLAPLSFTATPGASPARPHNSLPTPPPAN